VASKVVVSEKIHSHALIFAAFISGLCSIIYELLIATTASYFLGDSVKFFSITIGIYMAAMGIGTLISKYMEENILTQFVRIELALALIGGLSVPSLYFAYAYTPYFLVVYLLLTSIIGVLIGLEIPFLTRLMERYFALKINIANILSFDYFGALIATIAFPFVLLPWIGVYQSSLLFGFVNMSVAFVVLRVFKGEITAYKSLQRIAFIIIALLALMMLCAHLFLKNWDEALYEDRIIHSEQSKYQRIILTKDRDDVRLYLDGNLQFSSIDEYRYHEALVHVAFSFNNKVAVATTPIKRVLLLGAGDGLAVRELLKYDVEQIMLVDLDKSITDLAQSNPHLLKLNERSLFSEKVKIINADAFGFLQTNNAPFDLIIADLPDPNNSGLARLYSKHFYRLARRNLAEGGMLVTQATSPYFAPLAFWSVANTVKAAGFANVTPYHANVPSFGEWGFVLGSGAKLKIAVPKLPIATRYLTTEIISQMLYFPKDLQAKNAKINELDKPIILDYYLSGWQYYR
jgi:spermidine synthase